MTEHNLPEELMDVAYGEGELRGFWSSKEHDYCWLINEEGSNGRRDL